MRRLPIVCLLLFPLPAFGQEQNEDPAKAARKEKLLGWMEQFSRDARVTVGLGEDKRPAELVPQAVFRYSDEPRRITDATLWVWTRAGRPAAFQKVEVNDQDQIPKWTVCLASLSEQLIEVKWRQPSTPYRSTEPGAQFKPFPESQTPARSSAGRRFQMRALSRRFSAEITNGGDDTDKMRLLPRPIYEYSDPDSKLLVGAIFGLATHGTNPDILLLIEAREDDAVGLRWEFSQARMTTGGVKLKLKEKDVWSCEFIQPKPSQFETWTFYFLRRDLDDDGDAEP